MDFGTTSAGDSSLGSSGPDSIPSSLPETEPTETEPIETAPTETKPTETEPAETEPIYTMEQLEALDNKSYSYGQGLNLNPVTNRPVDAEKFQEQFGKYAGNFIAPDNNTIYLTFDCGYEHFITDASGKKVPVTGMILDVLKEKNVNAVFFVTLRYCQKNPDLVWRMINEGHTVGNHSSSHPVMTDISIEEMVQEVMELHNYVLENFSYSMTLFRPPTGTFSARSLAVVQNLGYKNVHWSFAYGDWDTDNQPDVDKSLKHILSHAHSGAIYLLHAISETNAALLGDAIDGFLAKGFDIALFS